MSTGEQRDGESGICFRTGRSHFDSCSAVEYGVHDNTRRVPEVKISPKALRVNVRSTASDFEC
jgi:hypothetical protein